MASIRERLPSGAPWRRSRGKGSDPQPSEQRQQRPPEPEHFVEMTLQEHLEELRSRILYSAITLVVAFIAGLALAKPLLRQIADRANVPQDQIVTISPTEGFVTYMKVALYIAIAFSMPVLVYQFVRFLAPGLTKRERFYLYRAIPFVVLMFAAGAAFAFFVLAPRALDFLSHFGGSIFRWDPRAEEIISFFMTLMLGVGLMFELPVVMFVLSKIGVVNYKMLSRIRKFAFIAIMVAAAIITPTPDPFNMMLAALPMYGLYELGVLLSRFARK
jgi:sec-independent protein translocase protein TatC